MKKIVSFFKYSANVIPMVTESDKPAIYLNKEIMEEFRPQLQRFYYDETKYGSYLEQLGLKYPTLRE